MVVHFSTSTNNHSNCKVQPIRTETKFNPQIVIWWDYLESIYMVFV